MSDTVASGKKEKIIYLAMVFFMVMFDQVAKFIAVYFLDHGRSVSLIRGVFHLTLVRNTGAAFGMLSGMPLLFAAIALLAAVFISYVVFFRPVTRDRLQVRALCFMLSGTIGNLIDRIRVGYVIDFLDLRVWPVFNIADSYITVGACLLAWSLLPRNKPADAGGQGCRKCQG